MSSVNASFGGCPSNLRVVGIVEARALTPGRPLPTPPPPPNWLVAALDKLKQEKAYASDKAEGIMRYSVADTNIGKQYPFSEGSQPIPSHVRFYFLPRIPRLKYLGRLYTPADTPASKFEVHFKNKNHRQRVKQRLAGKA
ncbi:hypothetical protein F5Y19DRAFT_481508 [Xylariaceae sp. FL1651]|nr:hypothetical protein F5Y19DRAFT_481508 [Xylariaceae sp. FL1651]